MTSAQDVEDYLIKHPDFLFENHDLLVRLQLSAPKSDAVPLIEHQANSLKKRNIILRDRMQMLISTARDNDVLFEKTRLLILAMLQASSVEAMSIILKKHLFQHFSVDFVELFIFNKQFNGDNFHSLDLNDAQIRLGNLATSPSAISGSLAKAELKALFGDHAESVGSSAIQPFHYGRHQGLIVLGSRDPNRYKSTIGTLFLGYVGEVIARLLDLLDK